MRKTYFASGYSLVEIMVAITVLSLFALTATTFITSTQSEMSSIKKKQSLEEYSEILRQSLASNSSCDWQLQAATAASGLDLTAVTAAHPGAMAAPMPKFYSGANNSSLMASRKQIIFLEQKQDISNYASVLDRVLSANSSCDWQLASASTLYPLDLSAVSASHPTQMSHSIDKFYIGPDANSFPVFEIGKTIPFSSHQIKAQSMNLVNILPTTDFSYYTANVEFQMDSSSLLRPVKNIVIPIKFKVNLDDQISAKRIDSCCAASGCSPAAPDALTSLINNTPQTIILNCGAQNNSSATCTRNILATTGLGLAGIPASSIHLLYCNIDSFGDMGGNPTAIHTVTYDPSTTELTLSISQATISVKIGIDTSPSGSSQLSNSFSCN